MDKRVLFISSTGGHFNELSKLKPMLKKYDYYIVTEKTKSSLYLKDKYPKKVSYLVYGTKDHLLKYIFKFGFNILKSIYLYFKIHPDYIITTGTHTAGPICCLGKIMGSRIVYIETYANITTRTETGNLLYKLGMYDLFIVQWKNMLNLYPKALYWGHIF